ncbi:MAG: hypothetical protein KC616_08650 [Myxococcales bacterium]|nr:hypothetical protein [Myxococcales bacterium]
MRFVPHRSAPSQLLAVFGSFAAGPIVGIRLADALAPDSTVAQLAAALGFCLTFVGGLLLWFGLGLFGIVRTMWRRRGGRVQRADGVKGVLVPPGYRSFVVLGLLLPPTTGLLVGLLSTSPLLLCMAIFTMAGLLYGICLRALAHHGYLPFPEPE